MLRKCIRNIIIIVIRDVRALFKTIMPCDMNFWMLSIFNYYKERNFYLFVGQEHKKLIYFYVEESFIRSFLFHFQLNSVELRQ